MNTVTRWLLGSLALLAACPMLYGQAALPEESPAERIIRDHAAYLNELSDRRRLNTFFPNEQSVFHGLPIRYVNSSRGNLAFVRRDLLTVGRIPIVLARVYDSSTRVDSGFGPGWRLSLAETIVRRSNDTLSYMDDSASELILVRRGSGYAPRDPGPTDIASVEARDDALRVTYRGGWTKQFKRNADRFVLVAIRDPHGNTLTLRYRDKHLSRIEAQSGRFVAIEWAPSGRIIRVTDDQQRAVSYAYDDHDQLETVTDLGGNRWRYQYDHLGRLERAIDPRNVATLEVAFDSDSRARSVQILGARYQYKYEEAGTLITDEANRVTRISHNRYGIATSVSNPIGFVSEVRLDEQNRVTTLLHKGAPRATFTYGPRGWVDTLTRFEDSGAIALTYQYDTGGRPTRITGTDGSRLMLEYNASGDLLRRTEGEETLEYEYTPQGDLRSVMQSGETTRYTHNSDGQIETIKSPRGETQLSYFPDGKLKSIRFADGSVHEYRYSTLGFRQEVERSDDTEIYYWYDAAGNLIRSEGLDAYGKVAGQTFEINDHYQAETIRFASGDITRVTYDANGNPETIATTDDPDATSLNYVYDGNNRVVAVADGETIIGSYVYEETEPDLRIQLDNRTMRVGAGALRQSATLGNILSVAYTRPYGSILGSVRFDEATRTFDLPSDFGVSLPDAVASNSLTRRKLVDIDSGDVEARINFDRPSNVMFLPPEYSTINCATNCVFNGIVVKGNGIPGTLSVPYGSTVDLTASKASQSTCTRLICSWSVDGLPIAGFGAPAATYMFATAGSHQVQAQCECSPCDVSDAGYLTVNVAPCAAGVSLQTQTEATIPSNRARTKLGVGERVTLSLSPAPPCSVTWSKSGNGTLTVTGNSSATFTAHERASTTTVTANIGGVQRSVTYNVVEPSGVVMEQVLGTGIWHRQGFASVGFLGQPYITPEDVSFDAIDVREGFAIGVGTGYLSLKNGEPHANGPWSGVSAGSALHPSEMAGIDQIQTGTYAPPFDIGTFTWQIPWLFKVGNGLEKEFTPVTHREEVGAAGDAFISKGGVTRLRNASDPNSDYF